MKQNITLISILFALLLSSCNKENPLAGVDNDGAINGLFSVSDTCTVKFSRGNLQYQASSSTWQFAEHQYDCIGNDNDGIAEAYTGWIDLFGWATSGWNSGAEAYMPYSTNLTDSDYFPGGNDSTELTGTYADADWGQFNTIANGGASQHQWRTLTSDEWHYILNARANAANKYGLAKVNGVDGLVLLPDNWTLPSGCEFTPGTEKGYKTNRYSASDWTDMQTAGAVFLPAAGYREESTIFTKFYYDSESMGCYGFYWSATPHVVLPRTGKFICSNNLFFCKENVNAKNFSKRHFGLAVRLVKDI